jgi:4-amino-4-deoxy-L-arabinose transferase-like glycosyltransferase
MKFKKKAILFFILVLAFIIRLYKIDNPVADWHSWRQADTAAVARNFIKFGFDPLRPRYDDLSNIASGKDNPMGWRMVEFPLYQLVGAGIFKIIGIFSIEVWLRLVTVFASVGSTYFLYKIGEKLVNPRFGLVSAFLFSVIPYSIYYGRTILPESLAVFFALGALVFFAKIKGRTPLFFYSLSAAFASSAILVKPTAGFLLVPIAYLAFKRNGLGKTLKSPLTYIFLFIVFTPFVLWRLWIQNFPEGIPSYEWLLNGDGIRFKGAWFYWLFGERIAKLILGYWGVFFLGLGILSKAGKKSGLFFHWLGLGAISYLIIFATGNVKHDYYQIIIIPSIVFYTALGTELIIKNAGKMFNRIPSYFLLLTFYFLLFALSWHDVRTFYWINNSKIVEAGKKADKILPKDAKVLLRTEETQLFYTKQIVKAGQSDLK